MNKITQFSFKGKVKDKEHLKLRYLVQVGPCHVALITFTFYVDMNSFS